MAVTREEKMWEAMLNDAPEKIPTAVTRKERMLQKLAKQACDNDTFSGGGTGGVSSWEELGEKSEKKVWLEPSIASPETDWTIYVSETPPKLVKGDQYVVVWDGVKYELAVTEYANLYNTFPRLGNTYLADSEFGEDTGEPFCIMNDPSKKYWWFSRNDSEPHTVEIYQLSKTITPIPPEYLIGRELKESDVGSSIFLSEQGYLDLLPIVPQIITSDGSTFAMQMEPSEVRNRVQSGILPTLISLSDDKIFPCQYALMQSNTVLIMGFSDVVLNYDLSTGAVTVQDK